MVSRQLFADTSQNELAMEEEQHERRSDQGYDDPKLAWQARDEAEDCPQCL